MADRITALVLAGPSGGGKTTVMCELVKADLGFELVRSATTRQKRNDGNDGEYIYMSAEEFSESVRCGKMLEYTEYGGNLYGTPHSEIKRITASGKIPLLILDLNGISSLRARKLDYDIYAVYIYAAPYQLSERLEKRYSDSGGKSSERYLTRMENNRRDYLAASEWCPLFDTAVESISVKETANAVLSAFSSKKSGISPERFVKMAEEF